MAIKQMTSLQKTTELMQKNRLNAKITQLPMATSGIGKVDMQIGLRMKIRELYFKRQRIQLTEGPRKAKRYQLFRRLLMQPQSKIPNAHSPFSTAVATG